MNYFVSIENSYQHSWQIELLIQSFKDKGIEDSLLVAIGVDDSNTIYNCKNLSNHSNKIFFKKTSSNSSLNKWLSLLSVLDKKDIFPLTVLNPHNIFCNDIPLNDKDLILSEDAFLTHNLIEDYFSDSLKEEQIKKNWLKIGNTLVLNNIPIVFFEDIVSYIKYFSNKKEFVGMDRAAINLSIWKNWSALFENKENIEIRPHAIESTMLGNVIKNIINYDHGIQPSFNKIWFSKDNFSMHPDNPIECLSKIRHTKCSDFIADIAKNYLN
jgi:hypothetical protein